MEIKKVMFKEKEIELVTSMEDGEYEVNDMSDSLGDTAEFDIIDEDILGDTMTIPEVNNES